MARTPYSFAKYQREEKKRKKKREKEEKLRERKTQKDGEGPEASDPDAVGAAPPGSDAEGDPATSANTKSPKSTD